MTLEQLVVQEVIYRFKRILKTGLTEFHASVAQIQKLTHKSGVFLEKIKFQALNRLFSMKS